MQHFVCEKQAGQRKYKSWTNLVMVLSEHIYLLFFWILVNSFGQLYQNHLTNWSSTYNNLFFRWYISCSYEVRLIVPSDDLLGSTLSYLCQIFSYTEWIYKAFISLQNRDDSIQTMMSAVYFLLQIGVFSMSSISSIHWRQWKGSNYGSHFKWTVSRKIAGLLSFILFSKIVTCLQEN